MLSKKLSGLESHRGKSKKEEEEEEGEKKLWTKLETFLRWKEENKSCAYLEQVSLKMMQKIREGPLISPYKAWWFHGVRWFSGPLHHHGAGRSLLGLGTLVLSAGSSRDTLGHCFLHSHRWVEDSQLTPWPFSPPSKLPKKFGGNPLCPVSLQFLFKFPGHLAKSGQWL